ncbi:hypothetical protein BD626DRAFT_572135 [Schizophyllum amplum]|uniref:Uncharacterized protein n=1 Tax=Schizophyllum amplum TaxID=97359 RepID=A0A550C5E6_9AGAR|nr:hypothetical protein BD626DRAFT_572135 [Auriculariopsis ampla]
MISTTRLQSVALVAIVALPRAVEAQYPYGRRRSRLASGAIAGIAVACACAALFCFLLAFCMRRRRQRAVLGRMGHIEARPVQQYQAPPSHFQGPPPSQPSYQGAYQPPPGPAPGRASPPPPPPAYDGGAKEQTYAPPPGSPPVQSQGTQSTYAPPPGAPPQAHTNDKDNGFIGGFRPQA